MSSHRLDVARRVRPARRPGAAGRGPSAGTSSASWASTCPGGVWPVAGPGRDGPSGRHPPQPGLRQRRPVAGDPLPGGHALRRRRCCRSPWATTGPEAGRAVLLLLPLGLAALHPAVLRPAVRLARRVTRRPLMIDHPAVAPHRRRGAPLRPDLGVHRRVDHGAVAKAIEPDASIPRLLFATVLSWIAGFVVMFAPGRGRRPRGRLHRLLRPALRAGRHRRPHLPGAVHPRRCGRCRPLDPAAATGAPGGAPRRGHRPRPRRHPRRRPATAAPARRRRARGDARGRAGRPDRCPARRPAIVSGRRPRRCGAGARPARCRPRRG